MAPLWIRLIIGTGKCLNSIESWLRKEPAFLLVVLGLILRPALGNISRGRDPLPTWLLHLVVSTIAILERYNLKMKSTITFSDLFVELNSNKEAYGDALKMSEELKKYSFLNKCFIIEKI